MASLFRQFLSPLHLSVELSIVLSIERLATFKRLILRTGNIAPVAASDTKYHSSTLLPPSLALQAFLAQMASADG